MSDWDLRFKAFCLILAIYFFIASLIAWITNWGIKFFDYLEWGLSDWFLFFSIFILIGMYMIYMSPYLEKWLVQRLKNQIDKIENIPIEKRQDDKQVKKEVKKQELQAKKSVDKVYGDEPE